MTQRKFEPETRGGYWVRNVRERESLNYPLEAEIGNHTGNPPSDDPLDWHVETFTVSGKYKFNSDDQSPFDLIEAAQ